MKHLRNNWWVPQGKRLIDNRWMLFEDLSNLLNCPLGARIFKTWKRRYSMVNSTAFWNSLLALHIWSSHQLLDELLLLSGARCSILGFDYCTASSKSTGLTIKSPHLPTAYYTHCVQEVPKNHAKVKAWSLYLPLICTRRSNSFSINSWSTAKQSKDITEKMIRLDYDNDFTADVSTLLTLNKMTEAPTTLRCLHVVRPHFNLK